MGLIKALDIAAAGNGKVVRLNLRDLEAEARELAERARGEADRIMAEATASREAINAQARADGRAEGWAEGYQRGSERGHGDALARHEQELRLLIDALASAATSVNAAREQIESAAIADAVELAVAIAERVAKRRGLVDPHVLLENVRAAVKLTVRGVPSLRIVIHPSQRTTLSSFLPDLQAEWPALGRAEIGEDERLAPGGCRVHTAHGGIDADLRTQLDRIASKLLPQREGGCSAGGGVDASGGGDA